MSLTKKDLRVGGWDFVDDEIDAVLLEASSRSGRLRVVAVLA